jgi:hypothetical protein
MSDERPRGDPAASETRTIDPESTFTLVERAQAGDQEALDRLFARHLPPLRRWARGRLPKWARDLADTDDLVQDTLLQTFRRLSVFEVRGPGALLSAYLLPGKAAVITEPDEEWQTPIDTKMEALGGHVFRRNWIAVEDAYYERQIAADREELAALEAELKKASAERKARLEARIEDTRHKLREKQDQLKTRIESTKREGDAKIKSLQQQLTTARDERKQRLEKRLAEVRADYRERSDKLHQAWELTKSALR